MKSKRKPKVRGDEDADDLEAESEADRATEAPVSSWFHEVPSVSVLPTYCTPIPEDLTPASTFFRDPCRADFCDAVDAWLDARRNKKVSEATRAKLWAEARAKLHALPRFTPARQKTPSGKRAGSTKMLYKG